MDDLAMAKRRIPAQTPPTKSEVAPFKAPPATEDEEVERVIRRIIRDLQRPGSRRRPRNGSRS